MEGKKWDKEGKRVNTRAGHPEYNWLFHRTRSSSKGPDGPLHLRVAHMGLRESVTVCCHPPLSVQSTELPSARLRMPGPTAALVGSHASGAKATSQVEKVLSTPTTGHNPSRLGDRPGGKWRETNGPGPWAGKQALGDMQWPDIGDPPANKFHWLTKFQRESQSSTNERTCVSLYHEFGCVVV